MSVPAKIYRRSELETIKPQIDADGCLKRYRDLWLDGVDDSSEPSLIGIGFHAIQHAYTVLLMEQGLGQDQELAQQAFIQGIAAAQTPTPLIPKVRDVWFWHAESFELPVDRFVSAEERGGAGDVGFSPDLVLAHPESNTLEIKDFKSGFHPPLTEIELRGNFQARVYSKYGQDRWPGFLHYKFTLVAVRFRKEVSVTFSPSELDAVGLEVQAAISLIEEAHRTNKWPATPGPSCHFCNLACDVAENQAALPIRITDVRQMHAIANWLLVADKQVKAARQVLKRAVGQFGPVTVNGVCWSNKPVESVSYPIKDLMAVLEFRGGMGAFEEEGMTISKSALKKVMKRVPQLEEDLSGVAQSKTSWRFGPAQPGLPPGSEEE